MMAHNESINNKKMKLIVILVDNPSLDPLTDELRTYIKSKSHLTWGGKWFWKNIRYRMPHIIEGSRQPRSTDPWNFFKRLSNRLSQADRVSDVRMSEITYQESPPGVRVSAMSGDDGEEEEGHSISVYSSQSITQDMEQVELEQLDQDSDVYNSQRSSEVSALMHSTDNGYNTDIIEYNHDNTNSDEDPSENDKFI